MTSMHSGMVRSFSTSSLDKMRVMRAPLCEAQPNIAELRSPGWRVHWRGFAPPMRARIATVPENRCRGTVRQYQSLVWVVIASGGQGLSRSRTGPGLHDRVLVGDGAAQICLPNQ